MFLFLCLPFLIQEIAASDSWNVGIDRVVQDYDNHQHDDIQRPCSIQDLNCIRSFFAHNTGCKASYGLAPEPFLLHNLPLEIAHANMTVILKDAGVKGLNSGKIEEFYINKKTGTLVLEVEFKKIIVNTPNTIGVYHLKGKEPLEVSYFSVLEFKKVSLTLTTRNFLDGHRAESQVYAYFSDAKPLALVSPESEESKDSEIILMKQNWLDKMALSAREAFLQQGPIYMSVFLNSNICDFGHGQKGIAA